MNNKLFLHGAILTTVIFLSACSTTTSNSTSLNEKEIIIESLIEKKNFIGIFERAEDVGYHKTNMNYILSDPVSKYFNAHAKNKAAVINILKENGFTVYENTHNILNKKNQSDEYDEIVSAGRADRVIRFYRYMSYGVFVYLKDNKITKVIANSGSDGL